MKPATSSCLPILGLPVAVGVALLGVFAATQPRRATVPATTPYVGIGGGCVPGTRLCPDGTCQAVSVSSCGSACDDCTLLNPPNSTPSCSRGVSCSFSCVGGYHQCTANCLSNTSTASCGTNCTPCPAPSLGVGSATCDGTSCGLTCASGYWQSAATVCSSQSFNASH
jgi:hypothetical protein